MSINVKALDMGPSRRSHRHGPPLLGRVQGDTLFPDVVARMQPSDSLPPSATTPVPLAVASLDADASSVPREADDTCARLRAVRRRPLTGSPLNRDASRRGEGLPGCEAILFVRAVVEHPAGYSPLLAQYTQRTVVAFAYSSTLGIRKGERVRGRSPTARTFACLRIADAISGTVARLATGWAGAPLAGQDSHLLDDTQSFMESLRPPLPIDPQGLVALDFLSSRQTRDP